MPASGIDKLHALLELADGLGVDELPRQIRYRRVNGNNVALGVDGVLVHSRGWVIQGNILYVVIQDLHPQCRRRPAYPAADPPCPDNSHQPITEVSTLTPEGLTSSMIPSRATS